jgi:glycerophosphoryl diester phosphodiesterase
MGATAVQAHRGSPDPATGIAENTLDAFRRARHLGAQGIELDVRRTVDGALAVHHDPVVPGAGTVGGLRAADLPAHVPLLPDVLAACPDLIVNIEIKNLPGEPDFDPAERVARDVAELVMACGRASTVVVSSFWPASLEAVRLTHADLATGLLVASWFDPALAVAAAVERGCTALHPHVDLVDAALVTQAHGAGLSVAAWTVNGAPRLAAVASAGVDTVITDDVALALATVGMGTAGS